MRKNTTNQIYIRNENKILSGFTELLKEKDEYSINVDDIIKKTKISRPGFYMHFKSIGDIYNVMDERVAQFFCDRFFKDYHYAARNLDIWFLDLFKSIKNDEIISEYIKRTNRIGTTSEIIGELCTKRTMNILKEMGIKYERYSQTVLSLYNIAMFSYVLSLIRTKLKNNNTIDTESIVAMCAEMFMLEFGEDWIKYGTIDKIRYYWKELQDRRNSKQ